MEALKTNQPSLGDIDDLVNNFLNSNQDAIKKIWFSKNKNSDLGYNSFLVEIRSRLQTSCITFVNSNLDFSILNSYLFPTVIIAANALHAEENKKIAVPICPAHKFLNQEIILTGNKIVKCDKCCEMLLEHELPVDIFKLHNMFASHNKKGYKCPDCGRFIPLPLDSSREVICPYFDCCFIGEFSKLSIMRHPTIAQKVKLTSLNVNIGNFNIEAINCVKSDNASSDSKIEFQQDLSQKISLLKETIDSQINSLYYTSSSFTRIHYISMYESFRNLIDKFPVEMVSYLINLKRGEALQNKIFQEYISILEKSLPFGFKKNNKMFKVTSLLDENLCIFDGISNFEGLVTDKKEIKNGTKEFYIGGRTASYSKPFYIGKLLDILDKKTNESIMNDVKEYSFSKISLNITKPGTQVIITHLRVPPHYQMGGMTYLNRVRRKIVDKVYLTIHGSRREIKYGK